MNSRAEVAMAGWDGQSWAPSWICASWSQSGNGGIQEVGPAQRRSDPSAEPGMENALMIGSHTHPQRRTCGVEPAMSVGEEQSVSCDGQPPAPAAIRPDMTDAEFLSHLKRLRMEQGLTQAELA